MTLVCPYWIKDTEFISKAEILDKHYTHYPFATTKKKVVLRSLRANDKNRIVCTPDIISFVDRIFSKALLHCLYIKIMKFVSNH